MDRDRLNPRTAMRLRADEAMTAALAAADDGAPSLAVFIQDTMTSIALVCDDAALDPRVRLALINDALPLIAFLKTLVREARAAPPGLIMEVGRRTNRLLCRYNGFVRAR